MSENLMNVTDKTPIEVILGIDEDGFTTARGLYFWLFENGTHYAKWLKENVTENPFAEPNEFSPIQRKPQKQGGRPTEDYKIAASLAKKISMSAKSARGEDARKYFLGCEQTLKLLVEANHQKELERAKGIAVRQAMTKAIQQSTENERMHGHAYSTYTNAIYKVLFGKDAAQLRKEYGIQKKDNLRDCFSAEELAQVESMERMISGLIDCGWGYSEIKEFIQNNNTKMIA